MTTELSTELSTKVDVKKRLEKLSVAILEKIEDQIDNPNPIPLKDLKDTLFGLIDRTTPGGGPQGEISQAARGAVLGALQGLASLSGASFNPESLSPEPRNVTEAKKYINKEIKKK